MFEECNTSKFSDSAWVGELILRGFPKYLATIFLTPSVKFFDLRIGRGWVCEWEAGVQEVGRHLFPLHSHPVGGRQCWGEGQRLGPSQEEKKRVKIELLDSP